VRSKRTKAKLKFIPPLLISFLWLAFAAAGSTQQVLRPAATAPRISQQPPAPTNPTVSSRRLLSTGTQVSLNGKTLPVAWSQWQMNTKEGIHTGISDAGAMQILGVELLDTKEAAKQPVQWFSQPITLASWQNGGYRYLDVTQLVSLGGWQIQADRGILRINTPTARMQTIRQGKQAWGDRLVVDLDRPTFWQVTQQPPPPKPKLQPPTSLIPIPKPPPTQEWLIAVNATADPALIQQFNPSSPNLSNTTDTAQTPLIKLENAPNLTTIRIRLPVGLSPRVTTLPNPNRLVIDLRPDAMVERDILWSQGVRWRQQFVNLGDSRFPVVWLEINPRAVGLTLKPIWSETSTLVGVAPIITTAQRYSAVAAINGGFFNRNNKLPLGAIRRDDRWLSSPILNRGAIAWNDAGQVKIGRLNLQETLITPTGQRLPILTLNSGYVQPGIARYSSEWGTTYTPLSDNELIVVVQNNQVTGQLPGGAASKTAFPIPPNGYLLAVRGNNAGANFLPTGTLLRQESTTQPADFIHYPQILGAGPLLVQNRQIVLDAKAEGFSDAFIREKAARSAICTTESGMLLVAAVHNRVSADGPSLTEIAKVMQQLGCVDALNLDGGSSTSLYLGGQLLNRSPRTAARVHNGLGVFLQPRP